MIGDFSVCFFVCMFDCLFEKTFVPASQVCADVGLILLVTKT